MRDRAFIVVVFAVLDFVVMSVVANAANEVVAQVPDPALGRYLTDDVVAVAYVDISQIDMLGGLEWIEKLGAGPEKQERPEVLKSVNLIQKGLDVLTDLGVRYVYVLFRATDITHKGPTLVVPVAKTGNPQVVLGMIRSVRKELLFEHWGIVDGVILGAQSAAQLEQLKTARPSTKVDLSAAWERLGGGHCGLLVFGDKDSRRVVGEMFPKLPAPFAAIEGRLIADHLQWGGVVADLPPEARLQVIVQTDSNVAAETLSQAALVGMAMVEQSPTTKLLKEEERTALIASLTPKVEGNQVVISFNDVFSDFDRVARLLSPPIRAARQAAQRARRMNQFKYIGLGILNYESANGAFPANASYSEDGKPLLSWRVLILPYTDELGAQELYNKFHFDEPWDSEHNRQLISQMPAIYADPDSSLRKINAQGRTTYVVPVGEGAAFSGKEGISYREIKDGTSNTILTVEVAPQHAVIWTQPADWQVDFKHPFAGLKREDRDWFTAGYCDGSVRIISPHVAEEVLRAYLTMDGGEVIPSR